MIRVSVGKIEVRLHPENAPAVLPGGEDATLSLFLR
jgi:hypothetical protein